MKVEQRHRRRWPWLALLLSMVLHVPLVLLYVHMLTDRQPLSPDSDPILVEYRPFEELPPEEVAEEEEEPDEDLDGQVVDLPKPLEARKPEDADYLAEYDITVEQETVSELFKIAPEVVAPIYSEESAFELEDILEMNVDDPSTGATAGDVALERRPNARFAVTSSRYEIQTKDGANRPMLSAHRQQTLQGAPSNDYLPDVDKGLATQLNANEFLWAGFLNRIKRMVSFYANQTLQNARPEVPVTKMAYDLTVDAMLDPEGNLVAVKVTEPSGIPAFDEAILEAWRLAAPFPNPPPGMVEDDGYIHIDDFGFHITIGRARAELTGIDPRQGVMFPGLQTTPGH